MGILSVHRHLRDEDGEPRKYRIFEGQYRNPRKVHMTKKERREHNKEIRIAMQARRRVEEKKRLEENQA